MESIRSHRGIGLSLLVLWLCTALPTMGESKPMMRAAATLSLNGRISALNGNTLFVTAADGKVSTLVIGAGAAILGRTKADLASIKPGEALGVTANRDKNGKLTATAIDVLTPELWKQARKGQFPMANGQVMTNALVTRLGGGARNHTVDLAYDMLTVSVAVPDNVEIHRMVGLGLADLKPGQNISARGAGAADGRISATSVTIDL